ncbi:MAG TPA: hypothetical protein VF426_00320 [Marmoricola sp.]
MGFRDRLMAKAAARTPDYRPLLSEALGADDELIGFTFGTPVAHETGRGAGFGTARLTGTLINKAGEQISKARHMGGDEGSIAHTLPRDASGSRAIVVSRAGFSVWDFQTPECLARVPRSQVASLKRAGDAAQGWATARITFADGSFFDYKVMDHEMYADFWTAAAGFTG